MTNRTPEHVLTTLFESDEWANAESAQKAAALTLQWLMESGFKIVDATAVAKPTDAMRVLMKALDAEKAKP
jgi:hypothetical protein